MIGLGYTFGFQTFLWERLGWDGLDCRYFETKGLIREGWVRLGYILASEVLSLRKK